ncbi:MAG TPA: hypothetical protein VFU89_05320 [Rhabdochlamydiaceae bacterium]|nr:hypothetical protein [Rhabdochlamydiaceae bacterium]
MSLDATGATNFYYYGKPANQITDKTYPTGQRIWTQLPVNVAKIRIGVILAITAYFFQAMQKNPMVGEWRWLVVIVGVALAAWVAYKYLLTKDPLVETFYKIAGGKEEYEKLPEFPLDKNKKTYANFEITWKSLEHPLYRFLTSDGRKGLVVKGLSHSKKLELEDMLVRGEPTPTQNLMIFVEKLGPYDVPRKIGNEAEWATTIFTALSCKTWNNPFEDCLESCSVGSSGEAGSYKRTSKIYAGMSTDMANEFISQKGVVNELKPQSPERGPIVEEVKDGLSSEEGYAKPLRWEPIYLPVEKDQLFFQEVQKEKASLTQEMQTIDQIFQTPCVQKFVTAIQNRYTKPQQQQEQSSSATTDQKGLLFDTQDMVAILLVILGIKPALTFSNEKWTKFLPIYTHFDEITAHFPHIKLVNDTSWHYVVNESPLSIFDPKHYLINCHSIADEILTYFPKQTNAKADQRLSYLLGYGPTWEALQIKKALFLEDFHQNFRIVPTKEYHPLHFQQLGDSIKRDSNINSTNEEVGRSYHAQVVEGKINRKSIQSRLVMSWLGPTGTGQIFDEFSMQTTYFKQSCFLKKYVLIKLGFPKTSDGQEWNRTAGLDCFLE